MGTGKLGCVIIWMHNKCYRATEGTAASLDTDRTAEDH